MFLELDERSRSEYLVSKMDTRSGQWKQPSSQELQVNSGRRRRRYQHQRQPLPSSLLPSSKLRSTSVFHNNRQLFHVFICLTQLAAVGAKVELEGPSFTLEPASVTYFSNSLGVTISCLSRGHPPLTTLWLTANGDPVLPVPGLRESLPNNSLYFGSFKPEEYSLAIHNGQYRCAVTNPVGTLISSIFSVRAVVDRHFDVYIADGGVEGGGDAIEDNPMILHCDVNPSFFKEHIQVIAWKSVDQFGYETEIQSDGTRYQVTSKGSLIIFAAKYQQLFVCVAQSVLNGKSQSSPPFLVKTKAGVGGLPPKSIRRWEQVISAEIGKPADLVCPAVGSPPPNFLWLKYQTGGSGNGEGVPVVVVLGNGVEMRGPLLSFSRVDISHNGTYRCEVTNNLGSFVLDITLLAIPVPVVTIEPPRKLLRLGQSLELTCKTSPSHHQNSEVTWFKNGKTIGSDSRVKVAPFRLLIFNAVIEDQGVYQCFSQVGQHNIQASSQVTFEASRPELLHTFISQSLQPGPAISMKCSATGNPIPDIQWFVDSQELLPSPNEALQARFWQMSDRYSIGSYRHSTIEIVSHINISQVRIEDSGDYRCVATNLISTVSHSARLNIYGPLFIKEMPSLTLVAGRTTDIPCMYGGFPVDQIVWRKNSRDLVSTKQSQSQSQSHQRQGRYTVLANGTLRIEQINTGGDKGQYTCVISNRKGEVASGTVDVNVMRPPVISAFNFDENLVEGQRASITCNVMSGDLPIDIVWLKDFQSIPSFLNITKERVKFLSYLIFEELRNEHSGVYTCSATNAAATANHSAILTVKVSPKWIQEPQDVRVILRTDHMLPCAASGVPKPSIKWYRESSLIKSEIKADRKFELGEDGSLRIRNVDSTDASKYLCEAVNGVGNGLVKSIQIYVNIPAKVSAPMTSVVVAEGLPALFKCQIRGDGPIEVVWRKNSIVIEQSPRIILQTVLDANSSVISAELRIEHSERSDSGLYVCIGSNHFGRDEDRISLEVKARPSPPENFIVEEIGSRFIRLRWSPGPQTLSAVPVTYFILQYKKSTTSSWFVGGGGEEIFNTTVQSPATHAVLEHLSPVANYDIRIFASNEIGHSLPTEPLAVLTLPEAPSGPPLNVSALPVSSKSVVIRWEPPHLSLQHGAILGYHVFIALQHGTGLPTTTTTTTTTNGHNNNNNNNIVIGGTNNNTLIVDEKWNHQTEVQGLRSNAQYRITVRAYNSAGMGPESPFVGVHTPEGAPDAPPINLRCEGLTPRSLKTQWDPPPTHLTNGQLQGYKVMYQPVYDEKIGEKLEVKKTSNRETVLHGLQSFTNYSVRTLAYTLGGEGVVSEPVFCLTEEDVPEEVEDIKAVVMGSSSILVSWLPPRQPNGRIVRYTVFWKTDDKDTKEKAVSQLDEEQLFLELRRLKENQRYYFSVTGSTNAGTGKSSRTESLLLTNKAQARIASFPVIRNVLMDQPILLPCKTVGQPSPKVSWLKNSRGESTHHVMRNYSLYINRVRDQDEGTYTCRAENIHGSDEIEHRITISRPPSKVPVFLGYVTSTSVQLHWELPQRADPRVIGFTLEYQMETASEWTIKKFGPRVSSLTLDNLLCGTAYRFRMAAENSVGLGEFSIQLSTKTNGNAPDMPKLTDILDGNGTMIRIDLNRWYDGGCRIKNFHIDYKTRESSNWQRIYRRDNFTRVFTFATTVNWKYDIRVSMENDAGSVMKTFHVESVPEFFANYGKTLERTEEQPSGSSEIFLTDPHVVVPVISAVICTCAVAICILIVFKRRAQTKDEWKFGQSASQQTWLSTEDNGGPKTDGGNKYSERPEHGGGNMSVYATLNSTKPIPMAIRDSTVRFQTFGQRDNYDAPVVVPAYYKKNRRKSSSSPPDGINLEIPCPPNQKDFVGQIDQRNYRYFEPGNNSDSDETTDSMYTNNYARPYQQQPYVDRRGNEIVDISGVRNTLKKTGNGKLAMKSRGSREYLE